MRKKTVEQTYFHEAQKSNGKIRIFGQVEVSGVYCKFSICEQKGNSEYIYRGSIQLLDASGEVHTCHGEELKKRRQRQEEWQKRHSEYSASSASSIPTARKNLLITAKLCAGDPLSGYLVLTPLMRDYIISQANLLISENPEVRSSTSSIIIDPSHDTMSRLYQKYSREYLNGKVLSEKTYKKQKTALQS